jgi:hypothetical protein
MVIPCHTCDGAAYAEVPRDPDAHPNEATRWTTVRCEDCKGTGEASCDWCGEPGADREADRETLHGPCVVERRLAWGQVAQETAA